jgi:peptidoglycan hydrolase-like protein with peptidoglycan-binding domain
MKTGKLSVGVYGPKVQELQQQLRLRGYGVSPSEITRAFFGPGTRAALRRWQQDHRLPTTGILDAETAAGLVVTAARAAAATPAGAGDGSAAARSKAGVARVNDLAGAPSDLEALMRTRISAVRASALSVAPAAAAKQAATAAPGCSAPNPFMPTVCIAVTSPQDGAQLVGSEPGASVTVSGTLSATAPPIQSTALTPAVTVQFGSADSPRQATVTGTLDPRNGGTVNWTYSGNLPVGGVPVQILCHATVTLQLGILSGVVPADAVPVNIQPTVFQVLSPQGGQVFIRGIDGQNCTIEAIGSTNDQSVFFVSWGVPGDPALGGGVTPAVPNDWTSWTANVTFPLATPQVLFEATDPFNNVLHQQTVAANIGVPTQILDVEPVSYLQSLVDFGTEQFNSDGTARVVVDGAKTMSLTPELIDSNFFESIGDILDPQNAAKANEPVYQTRICVEVLRKYLGTVPPSPEQARTLAAAEAAYRQAGYTSLLQQIGTSFDEIRLARTYDRQDPGDQLKLQAIADRLAIELGAVRPDHLDRLCFDPSAAADSVFTFELTVADSNNATARIPVDVTIHGTTQALTATAGDNRTVSPGETVTLTGNATDTAGGATISYRWTQHDGPPVTLTNATAAVATFVAPPTTIDVVLSFEATVADSLANTATAIVRVIVFGSSRGLTVSAGASQTVNPGVSVTLAGSAASTGATITSYQWTQIAGPPVQLNNADSAAAGFVAAAPAAATPPIAPLSEQILEETFGLVDTTRDPFSQGATIGDTRQIVRRWHLDGTEWNRGTDPDGIAYLFLTFAEGYPAEAALYRDAARTTLLATGRGGAPGELILSPIDNSGVSGWVSIGESAGFELVGVGLSVFPRFLSWQFQRLRTSWLAEDFPADDVLTFQLEAIDSRGRSAAAFVTVNVSHIVRPAVNAGSSQTVRPGATVNLDSSATASAAGATITAYQWSQVSGPPVTLNMPNTASASFVAPAVAADTPFCFQLAVTDSTGATAVATVNVTVYHVSRLAIDAGPNQSVNPGATVTLTSTVADPNPGAAITYQWTQTAGPAVALTTPSAATAAFPAPTPAADTVLSFRLAVSDSAGAAADAVVSVTVNGTVRPLTASAGASQTVEEGAAVSLVGSASGPGANITYSWTQTEGPQVALSAATAAAASFAAPAVDADTVFVFEFSATDSAGNKAGATASVTVHPIDRPIMINCGASFSVAERAAVSLAGSAADAAPGASIAAYRWTLIGGPSVALSGAETDTLSFVAPSAAFGPIVDPDLLVGGDFKHRQEPPYTDLYVGRRRQVQGWIAALRIARQSGAAPLDGLNRMLASVLAGKQLSDLQNLEQQSQAGTDIGPQLEALFLSLPAFNDLLRLGALLQGGQPLLESEWNDVLSILVEARKLQSAPLWRSEQVAELLSLGPDHFNYPTALPDTWSTGLNEVGNTLADGATDPHWVITATPGGLADPPDRAYATDNQWPLGTLGAAWMPNTATSRWISPKADETQGSDAGAYTYQAIIDLAGYDPASVALSVNLWVDNDVTAVRLNGIDLGLGASGFAGFATLAIGGPFRTGLNALEFDVCNRNGPAPNPTGLRAEFAFAVPPQLLGIPAWRGSQAGRQSWQDLLQARIGQDATAVGALNAAVDGTEAQTLSRLRDALVQAGNASIPAANISLSSACNATTPEIPGPFSTGLNAAGDALADGARDPHWDISQLNGKFVTPPYAYATDNVPFVGYPWIANSATSRWISPRADEINGSPPGTWTYVTRFETGAVPFPILARVAVADRLAAVRINAANLELGASGASGFSTLTIRDGHTSGPSLLEMDVVNDGSTAKPSGLRAEMSLVVPVAADWLAQRLLIDVRGGSRAKTTRLGQATTTLQTLYFALRNYEFQQMQPPPEISTWALNYDDPGETAASLFDQEWAWMGSYSSWQSVAIAFLWPENLLQPITRLDATGPSGAPRAICEKTTAFDSLVTRLDGYGGALTSQAAITEANQYLTDLGNTIGGVPVELSGGGYADPRNLGPADLAALTAYASAALTKYTQICNWTAVALLWEAWYFVAVQIALALQGAGQYEAALAWFGILYTYDLPLAPPTSPPPADLDRRIFPGLVTENASANYLQSPSWLLYSTNPHQIAPTRASAYTRFTALSIVRCLLDFADAQFAAETDQSLADALGLYLNAATLLTQIRNVLPRDFVTESNQLLAQLDLQAQNSLSKLRSGLNIAGKRRLLPGASIEPTAYRYSALIDRAKQLVGLAQQVEGSYLAALQKGDEEAYNAIKAQQDVQVANATVNLQGLQQAEAAQGVNLAQDQVQKATDQENHYQDLINKGLSDAENGGLIFQWGKAIAEGVGAVAAAYVGQYGAAEQLAQSAVSDTMGAINTQNSYDRRAQDWQFQRDQAADDVVIANEQITIAKGQEAIASQQLAISQIQANNAQATLTFLATKFTNVALYRWMSGVLGGIYAYFLQQAAAMARLAESQLAFERQEPALSIIQQSYWQPVVSGNVATGGLTGAERLLEDITALDQNAFETDRLKLQLTKTISLSEQDPFAFQQFTLTGVLRFATPRQLFDRDFPGQYLRLIKQVRVSIVALIPPNQGIRATLANHGISRVVVEDDVQGFRTSIVQRDPQLVALSAPANATGLFDLSSPGSQLTSAQTDVQSGLLLPFEGLGVDTAWEFILPSAANPFDFTTIADVLVTIDYTALYDFQYQKQIVRQLDRSVSADLGYSFRQQFADAWYDLNNPQQSSTPMIVQFQTQLLDFPPNVENLSIQQVVIYFVPASGQAPTGQPTAALTLVGTGANGSPRRVTGTASAVDQVISTRRGNAPEWSPMIGMSVAGMWTLDLSNPDMSGLFQSGQIQDILFVITYKGQTPAWPV